MPNVHPLHAGRPPAAPTLRGHFRHDELAVGQVLRFLGAWNGIAPGSRWEVVGVRRRGRWQRRDGVLAESRWDEVELAQLPRLRERLVRQAHTLAVAAYWVLEEA